MNILALGEFPPKTQTGVSISNRLVCDVLSANGHRVTIIEEYSWKKNGLFIVFHYIQIYIKVLFKLLFTKVDILYFNLPLSFQAQLKIFPVIILSKLRPRCKRIGHLHRGDFSTYCTKAGKLQLVLLRKYLKSILRLIVLSDTFKSDVLQFHPDIDIHILANTSDYEGESQISKKYSGSFICIANYIESKGVKDLVKCFSSPQFNDLKLKMYGCIYDNELYHELKNIATPNIELHGELSRSEVKSEIIDTDCLILPSWNEGQPIIILEAMSLGVPVIATNVGDIPHMLPNWPFLANPQNVQSLKEQIESFHAYNNKGALSDQILKLYSTKYALEKYKVHLHSIFDL